MRMLSKPGQHLAYVSLSNYTLQIFGPKFRNKTSASRGIALTHQGSNPVTLGYSSQPLILKTLLILYQESVATLSETLKGGNTKKANHV